jgi:hypothetical protein
VPLEPGILARGPWSPEQVEVQWSDEAFEPAAENEQAADRAIADLQDRGSPAHDGLAARLAAFEHDEERLRLRLQPTRWSLRLVEGDASASLSVLCVVRDAHGRWLAGRRAGWLASWPGRWALGAAGAVELGEDPVGALWRELEEEWSVQPERATIEALALLPNRLVMLVGQAWLPEGAEVVPDEEHDEHAWWPSDPELWPDEAAPELRRMAQLLG